MKTKLSLLCAAALVFAPALVAADPATAPDKQNPPAACDKCEGTCKCEAATCKCEADKCKCDKKSKKKKPKKEEMVMLTGSHLPQRVTKVGRITDGVGPVTVLTRDDLSSSGAADVGTALRRLVPAMY